MPTSQEEANKIYEIINEFLTFPQAREVTKKLDDEVGALTDNDSLKTSLHMLRSLYDKES